MFLLTHLSTQFKENKGLSFMLQVRLAEILIVMFILARSEEFESSKTWTVC